MRSRAAWGELVILVGLVCMLLGAVDPLEGSLLILPGIGLTAGGAFVAGREERRRSAWAFLLATLGIGALWGLSAIGGIGGRSGHTPWWALTLIPYPAGWVMAVLAAIRTERSRALLYWALGLMALGIVGLTTLGDVGPSIGLSRRAGFFLVTSPYPMGLLLGLLAAILEWVHFLRRREPAQTEPPVGPG